MFGQIFQWLGVNRAQAKGVSNHCCVADGDCLDDFPAARADGLIDSARHASKFIRDCGPLKPKVTGDIGMTYPA